MNNFFQQFFQNTIDLATFYTTDKEEPTTLAAGIYDTAALMAAGISNNSIYRVDIPSGFTITLFSEDIFSGDKLQLTSSSSSLGKLDKATSSLIIRDPSEDENNSVTSTEEETVTESEPVTESEIVTESEPVTEEETVTESAPVTEEETVTESEPVTEEETVTESEPVTEEEETVTESEPVTEGDATDDDVTDDDDTELRAIIYFRDSDGNDLDPVSLQSGEYNSQAINELGIMNDGIYKIDVPNGLKVTLFSEDDFSGSSYFVTSDAIVDIIEPTYSIIVETNILAKNIMISPSPSTESTPAPFKSKSTSKLPHLNIAGNLNYSNEISLSQIPIPVQPAIRVPKSVKSKRVPKQVQTQSAPKQFKRAPKQVQTESVPKQFKRAPKQVQTESVQRAPKQFQPQRAPIPPKPVQRAPIPPKPVQRAPIPVKTPAVSMPVQVPMPSIPVQIEPDEDENELDQIFPSIVPSIYKEFDIVVKNNFGADLIPYVSNTNLLIIILVFIILAIILR